MPTYGYRCQACGAEFDVVQRMTDPAEASCPSCNGAGKRLFFPVGIAFKGQGFYKTDSRASSATTASTSGDGAASNGSSTGSSNGSAAKDAGSTTTTTPPASSKGSTGSSAATT